MKKALVFVVLLIFVQLSFAQSKKVLFETEYGDIKVVLYDFTPNHRDLIINAISDSVYQGALFNRIIKDFVVQGGEHDIDIENREKANPQAPKLRLAPEFDDRAFHKVGALGAGRDGNKEKASFLNQLYFVVGKSVTSTDLDQLEQKKGVKFTDKQRKTYFETGGQPRLDHDYTVFGEIYEGLNVIKVISELQTDKLDYPIKQVSFKLSEIE